MGQTKQDGGTSTGANGETTWGHGGYRASSPVEVDASDFWLDFGRLAIKWLEYSNDTKEFRMPRNGVRSTYSQAPFRITTHDYGGEIATGTAFHYTYEGRRFIVTNWHNLTGKDFFTGKNLNAQARTPLWINVHTAQYIFVPGIPGAYAIIPRRIELYQDAAAQLDPLWLEHPQVGGRGCDVVAIPYEKPANEPEFMHNSVNLISTVKIPVRPGEQAFVIGFPRGLSTGFGLPIWKSTFIASEPFYGVDVGVQKLSAFFLDGYTREGMSGSPVFARYRGMWDQTDPYMDVDIDAPNFWSRDDVALGAEGTEFIGIYSGRIPESVGEAAIGVCWRNDVIDEVCASFKPQG